MPARSEPLHLERIGDNHLTGNLGQAIIDLKGASGYLECHLARAVQFGEKLFPRFLRVGEPEVPFPWADRRPFTAVNVLLVQIQPDESTHALSLQSPDMSAGGRSLLALGTAVLRKHLFGFRR